jgi:hypothetical protein
MVLARSPRSSLRAFQAVQVTGESQNESAASWQACSSIAAGQPMMNLHSVATLGVLLQAYRAASPQVFLVRIDVVGLGVVALERRDCAGS